MTGMDTEVRFTIDEDGLRQIDEAQRRLGSPNLGTALYNAVTLMLELYEYTDQGYELRRVKGDNVRRLRLPG